MLTDPLPAPLLVKPIARMKALPLNDKTLSSHNTQLSGLVNTTSPMGVKLTPSEESSKETW